MVLMNEQDEMAKVSRQRDLFEGLWARYVGALSRFDAATSEAREARRACRPSHAFRVVRGARKEAERLRLRLVRDFDMKLGGLP